MKKLDTPQENFETAFDSVLAALFHTASQDEWTECDAEVLINIRVPQKIKHLLATTAENYWKLTKPDAPKVVTPDTMETAVFSYLVYCGLHHLAVCESAETTKRLAKANLHAQQLHANYLKEHPNGIEP